MKRIAIFAVLLLSGCARYHVRSGDFSQFMTETLISCGADIPNTPAASEGLPSTWRTKSDNDGIIILAPHSDFSAVDRYLRSMFNEPDIWTENNSEGYPMGVFNRKTTGCPIQYVDSKHNVQIIILKNKEQNHGLESTGAPPAAGTPETHP